MLENKYGQSHHKFDSEIFGQISPGKTPTGKTSQREERDFIFFSKNIRQKYSTNSTYLQNHLAALISVHEQQPAVLDFCA